MGSQHQRYLGSRRATLFGIAIVALLCGWVLNLNPARLCSEGRFALTLDFLSAAFRPAFTYENPTPGAEPFLQVAIAAVLRTFRFAVLAMSVAVPCGALLTFFASTAWWPDLSRRRVLAIPLRALYFTSRAIMAFARSIHELIWGLLFITAMGMSTDAAVIAVAIPFSGILAKIYSEMLEEHARDSQRALRAIGGGALIAFIIGLLPRAVPDLVSYTFYRLECALRTAAVFGFVGIETIGYHIKLASDEFHYREIWTYLYLLFAAVALIEWWGASIRKRLKI